ncbi:hypothetical protein GCM10007049_37890 [Echinicola pacifica]|uniref:NlpE N-terminal domain-containing protein n=1 Tax=Echinicola pacifica TaxID=346377 RepID=A0A918QCK5_9BACT|nr:copper resistance protein NlpE [Echinicola pacifica]GGZ40989.1 hypothetical protein GCM10007049_37890 [Echinicola pacifica]
MSNRFPTILILFSLLIWSCDSPTSETTNEGVSTADAPAEPADKALETESAKWYNYEGNLPCADCSAIKTTLQLENSPGKTSREYILEEVYMETADGNRKFQSTGKYEVSYGLEGHPGAMVISLLDDQGQKIRHFMQENDTNKLTQLDQEGMPIESELNYSLVLIK